MCSQTEIAKTLCGVGVGRKRVLFNTLRPGSDPGPHLAEVPGEDQGGFSCLSYRV
ncbi:MAG: hypothetical protein AAGK28_04200 [Pseudomonadota bacterium]